MSWWERVELGIDCWVWRSDVDESSEFSIKAGSLSLADRWHFHKWPLLFWQPRFNPRSFYYSFLLLLLAPIQGGDGLTSLTPTAIDHSQADQFGCQSKCSLLILALMQFRFTSGASRSCSPRLGFFLLFCLQFAAFTSNIQQIQIGLLGTERKLLQPLQIIVDLWTHSVKTGIRPQLILYFCLTKAFGISLWTEQGEQSKTIFF